MRVERRADGAVELDGYVNAVERDSSLMRGSRGPFVERVAAGAFERALERGNDVELRFNHARPLGTRNNGDVELWEDAIGLRAKAVVTDAEVEARAVAGELTGWSFTFAARPGGDTWEDIGGGVERRTLNDFDLLEVSVLDKRPAYPATMVEMRDGSAPKETRSMDDGQTAALPPREVVEVSEQTDGGADIVDALKRKIEIARRRAK